MHPVIRGLHDVGLAAWTGGSLMGAVGLNAAAAALPDPAQRSQASTAGWSRWAPVNAAALGAHLTGAAGLLITEWPRVRTQAGFAKSTAVKTAATGVGLGVAGWSAVLNRRMAHAVPVPVAGATEAAPDTPPDVAATLRQLKVVQWLNPAVGAGLIVLTTWQGEQQRPEQVVAGRLQRLLGYAGAKRPTAAATAAAAGIALLAARRRTSSNAPAAGPGLAAVNGSERDLLGVDDVDVVLPEVDVLDIVDRPDDGYTL